MNNFKKLLASAMALSMVASVLPVTNVDAAPIGTVCSADSTDAKLSDAVKTTLDQLVSAIGEENLSTVKLDTEVEWIDGNEYTVQEILESTSMFGLSSDNDFTNPDNTEGFIKVGDGVSVETALKVRAMCNTGDEEAKFLGYMIDGVNELVDELERMNVEFYEKNERTDVWDVDSNSYVRATEDGDLTTEAGIRKFIDYVKRDYSYLINNPYQGNLGEGRENGLVDELYDRTVQLNADAIESYYGDNFEQVINEYTTVLAEEIADAFGTSRGDEQLDWEHPESVVATSSKLKTLNNLLADIEDDKIDKLVAIASYEDVADDVDVMAMMENLELAIENVETVIDLTAEKDNEVLDAYTSRNNDGKDNMTIVGVKVEDIDWKDTTLSAVYANFTTEEIAKLQDFVEEIANAFYDVTTRTYGSKYSVRITGADYYGNLSESELDNIVSLLGMGIDDDEVITDKGIFTLADDEGHTYYDLLVARLENTKAYLEAATTGIQGITVNNLNSANAASILAAKTAVDNLDDYNLTDEEQDAYDEASAYVNVLYNYMLYNGIVAEPQNGWIDLGNGDWDYYVDGQAFTGWYCSATDVWYYVRDGHMLRNTWVWRDANSAYYVGNDGVMLYGPATTPDGYAIDANGLWHR